MDIDTAIKKGCENSWTIVTEKESKGFEVESALVELRTNYYVDITEMTLSKDFSIVLINETDDKIEELDTIWQGTSLSDILSCPTLIGFTEDDFNTNTKGRIKGKDKMLITHYSCLEIYIIYSPETSSQ